MNATWLALHINIHWPKKLSLYKCEHRECVLQSRQGTCYVCVPSPPGVGVAHLECTADSERASSCAARALWAWPSARLPLPPLSRLLESESGSWTSLSAAHFAGNTFNGSGDGELSCKSAPVNQSSCCCFCYSQCSMETSIEHVKSLNRVFNTRL